MALHRHGAATTRPPRVRLRITADHDAELYCWGCHEWLALTVEFWPAPQFWRCRACESDRSRLYAARHRFDPDWRHKQLTKSRRYRAYIKGLEPAIAEAEAAERREREAARLRSIRTRTEAARSTREYKREWQRTYRAERKQAA